MVEAKDTKEINSDAFRNVMGHYPTGVALVTGRDDDGKPLALVVGTFSSVSLEPPLVSFMPMKSSRTFDKMRSCSSLCINVIGQGQENEVIAIARRWENKLDGIDWFPSPAGDPVLNDSICWIDTEVDQIIEAGDHWIVLCAVQDLEVINPVTPLLFFQGGYGGFVGSSQMGKPGGELLPSIHAAHASANTLSTLAQDVGCEVTVHAVLNQDDFMMVYADVGEGVEKAAGLAERLPIVPPIGDSYIYAQPDEVQQRWMAKVRGVSEDFMQVQKERLAFLQEHKYIVAFLPEAGSKAYESMVTATRQYMKGALTPAEERAVRDAIASTDDVDYRPRAIESGQRYNMAALAFPIHGHDGDVVMTLRIAQLPQNVLGAEVLGWVERAQDAVREMENNI